MVMYDWFQVFHGEVGTFSGAGIPLCTFKYYGRLIPPSRERPCAASARFRVQGRGVQRPACVEQGRGGGGGWGGDKNVIHLASMPKTLVFTAFSPLCTTYCTRMWNKKICHKRPCLS